MRSLRLLAIAALLLGAAPSFATTFSVLGWTPGESINVTLGGASRTVLTAQFNELLDGVAGTSFCVDLSQHINRGSFTEFVEYDPAAAESMPLADGSPPREFIFAAQIVEAWSSRFGELEATLSVTDVQVITGLQAAVWKAVYGSAFTLNTLSAGARSVYDYVLRQPYASYGNTTLLYSGTRQDQLFTPPIPEPSALLVFAAGALLVGRGLRRRLQA